LRRRYGRNVKRKHPVQWHNVCCGVCNKSKWVRFEFVNAMWLYSLHSEFCYIFLWHQFFVLHRNKETRELSP
jgi:hypothetical protein